MNTRMCQHPDCEKVAATGPGCSGKYCSKSCSTKNHYRLKRIQKQKEYLGDPKLCEECHNLLLFEKRANRFCSYVCAGKYNGKKRIRAGWHHSLETKNKIRQAAIANPTGWAKDPTLAGIRKGQKDLTKWQINICPTCDTEFETYKKQNKKYCSPKCVKSGGIREGSGRAKTGYYKGTYAGSTYELVYLIYCIDHGKNIQRCNEIFEYRHPETNEIKPYHPDFVVDGTIIEIKGWHTDLVEVKARSVTKSYQLLFKEDIQYAFDYVETQYNTKKFETLYDTYKPKYGYTCTNCNIEFSRDWKGKSKETFCSRKCCGQYRAQIKHKADVC